MLRRITGLEKVRKERGSAKYGMMLATSKMAIFTNLVPTFGLNGVMGYASKVQEQIVSFELLFVLTALFLTLGTGFIVFLRITKDRATKFNKHGRVDNDHKIAFSRTRERVQRMGF